MADIKRTTEGLEHCLARYVDGLCDDCPYMGEIDKSYMNPMKCKEIIMRDALELLKEQQPKKKGKWKCDVGHWIEGERETGEMIDTYACSYCGFYQYWKTPFCPNCGAVMNQDDEEAKNITHCKDCGHGKHEFNEQLQHEYVMCELFGAKGLDGFCDEAEPKDGVNNG